MTLPPRDFFDQIAHRYDRDYALDASIMRARMRRLLRNLRPASRILDLGVGSGRELPYLLDAGHEPVGIDVSPRMLARCAARSRPIPLTEGDFWEPLPFADASFDAVIALHGSISHPPDDRAVARLGKQIARVIRAGGIFLAEVPSTRWLARLPPREAMGAIWRVDDVTARYRDEATGAEIAISVFEPARWHALLGWPLDAETLDDDEVLLVGHPRTN